MTSLKVKAGENRTTCCQTNQTNMLVRFTLTCWLAQQTAPPCHFSPFCFYKFVGQKNCTETSQTALMPSSPLLERDKITVKQ